MKVIKINAQANQNSYNISRKVNSTNFRGINDKIAYTFNGNYDVVYRKALRINIKTIRDCEKVFNMLREAALKETNKISNIYLQFLKLPMKEALAVISGIKEFRPIVQEPDKSTPLVVNDYGELCFRRINRRDDGSDSFCFVENEDGITIKVPGNGDYQRVYAFWDSTGNIKKTYSESNHKIYELKYYNKDGEENFWKNFFGGSL